MSKFNPVKPSGPSSVNFMGEKAYRLSDKEALVSLVMTTFLSDSYYATESEIVRRITGLVETVGCEFAAKLAIYARTTGNMRSVSHLLAALVCKDALRSGWLGGFYDKVVVRPDDMSEILCCYSALNGMAPNAIKKIPNSMKRGFRKALERLTPYQIDKYKMTGKAVSMIDLVNLFHPVPNQTNSEAYRRLMNGESLDGTYSAKIFEKEMSASCQGSADDVDFDKVAAKHDAIKSVLEAGMPVMNLLRNLRNIMIYAPDLIDTAISQLTNRDRIVNSRLLPFRFASAYAAVSNVRIEDYSGKPETGIRFESDIPAMSESELENLKAKVLRAVDSAMKLSCENVPALTGNCAILIDHSGSVRGDRYSSSGVSQFSQTTTAMIGNLFGSIMTFKQPDVYVGMFGDRLISPTVDRSLGLLEFNQKTYDAGSECGRCTENGLYQFMKTVIAEKKRVDNLIVFSDMEIGDGGEGGWDHTSTSDVNFHTLFADFRKINPGCLTVCCNINNRSGTSVFNPNLNLLNISGWSNSIFDLISMYKDGKLKSMSEEIEKIRLV